MAKPSLPPGFRFHPTDVELSCYYLKRKIMGKSLRFKAISEIEIYKFAPWDLPEKSFLQSKDLQWYFFCSGNKKYANGSRKNRATDIGYWKTTGKDRTISHNSRTVAMKKTLVFHLGKAPKGTRTDWVMHEYRLEDKELADAGFLQDTYVLCRIFQKSGPGPKNGEQYGAPFKEEEWENDKVDESSVLVPPTSNDSLNLHHNLPDHSLQPDTDAVGNFPHSSSELFRVRSLLQVLSEKNDSDTLVVQENNGGEMPDPFIIHGTVAEEVTTSNGNGIFDGLEDLSSQAELNTAEGVYFPNNMQEYALQHALLELSNQAKLGAFYDIHSPSNIEEEHMSCNQLETDDGSYMEMKDFQFPVEGHCSELVYSDDLFGNSSFQNLGSTGAVALLNMNASSLGVEGSSGNTGGQHLGELCGPSTCQTADEIGSPKSIQSSTRGEPHKLPSEAFTTNEGNSSAKLQYWFGSIPSRPAIAAEYPSTLKEKLNTGVSYYGSSIHVKAQVILQCPCAEDSEPHAGNDFLSANSGKWMPCRKIDRGSHSCGNGFAFVVFLGVILALMWTFLPSLGAKLGKSAWKLFLSS
uniref:NAC domain-containing protein 78 n=2 Tax=Anthurium amnicola TaxID=1678845 RepID=A0A1D1YJF5_9ARAE